MSQPPIPTQYSPDGLWWWDGNQWLSVPEPSRPAAVRPLSPAAPLPMEVPRPRSMFWPLAGVAVLLLVLGAAGGTTIALLQNRSVAATPPTPEATAAATLAPAAVEPSTPTAALPSPTPLCAPMPCALNSDGMTVYVTGVTWGARPVNGFIPDGGRQLVRVALTFKNQGTATTAVNPLDFKLRDANGVERGFFVYEPAFEAADLASGGTISGTESFSAAPGTHTGVLIWSPGVFDGYHYLPIG